MCSMCLENSIDSHKTHYKHISFEKCCRKEPCLTLLTKFPNYLSQNAFSHSPSNEQFENTGLKTFVKTTSSQPIIPNCAMKEDLVFLQECKLLFLIIMTQRKDWTELFSVTRAALMEGWLFPVGQPGELSWIFSDYHQETPYFVHVTTSSAFIGKSKPIPSMLQVKKHRKKLPLFSMLDYRHLGIPVLLSYILLHILRWVSVEAIFTSPNLCDHFFKITYE